MLIDSHAHIDGPEYDADREEVIVRAREAGVTTILNVGTGDPHSGSFERAARLANDYKDIYAAIGVHPHDARLYDNAAEKRIHSLIKTHPKILAWGEIGLDYHYDNSPRDTQRQVFRRQLQAARVCDLPVVIHTRSADADTIEILRLAYPQPARGGIMHCFGGSIELALAAIDLGFYISFSGNITFKKAEDLREIAAQIPRERLLIETDCPYLTPVPFRGKRNEPARVVEVARCLAEIQGVSLEEIGRITSANFTALFRLQQI
ncbi:MAG TPA: TatD family hydrolase [Pyrinomonadaceae bacterium]|nr:TatD family hydrolase [Pyrinomonadaceae bacterium]